MYTKNAAEKANLSTSSYYWYKTDATGSGITTRYSKTSTTVLNEGEYIRLYSCASNYIRTIDYLVYHCEYNSSTDIYEWRPVSGYTDGTCIPTNCTAAKAAEKSGLSKSSKYWIVTDSTGSRDLLQINLGVVSTVGLAGGVYLKLFSCASGYRLSGTLIYHCEYNSGTDTYEWNEVSGYSSGTCVEE